MGSLKRFHVLLFISLLPISAAFTSTFAVGSTPATAAESDGWVQQDSGTTQDLFSVSAVDSSTAWAAGAVGTVLRTTDGGLSWCYQFTSTTPVFRLDIGAIDRNVAWAVGTPRG